LKPIFSRPRTPKLPATIEELGPPSLPTVPLPKKDIFGTAAVRPKKPVEPVRPQLPPTPKPKKLVTYSERSSRDEFDILYRFLTKGLDLEDVRYFQISYQMMLKREEMSKLLNYTHWVDHPVSWFWFFHLNRKQNYYLSFGLKKTNCFTSLIFFRF
jgi:hypothetical protein